MIYKILNELEYIILNAFLLLKIGHVQGFYLIFRIKNFNKLNKCSIATFFIDKQLLNRYFHIIYSNY
jgi:hypothetical protein